MNQTLCFQPNMRENVIFHRLPEVSSSGAAIFCSAAGDLGIEGEPRKPQGDPWDWPGAGNSQKSGWWGVNGARRHGRGCPKGSDSSIPVLPMPPPTHSWGDRQQWGPQSVSRAWTNLLGQGQAADLCNIREAEELDSWFQGWSAVDRQAANSPTDKQPKPPRQQKYKGGDQ